MVRVGEADLAPPSTTLLTTKQALRNCFAKGETPHKRYVLVGMRHQSGQEFPALSAYEVAFEVYRGFAKQFLRHLGSF